MTIDRQRGKNKQKIAKKRQLFPSLTVPLLWNISYLYWFSIDLLIHIIYIIHFFTHGLVLVLIFALHDQILSLDSNERHRQNSFTPKSDVWQKFFLFNEKADAHKSQLTLSLSLTLSLYLSIFLSIYPSPSKYEPLSLSPPPHTHKHTHRHTHAHTIILEVLKTTLSTYSFSYLFFSILFFSFKFFFLLSRVFLPLLPLLLTHF